MIDSKKHIIRQFSLTRVQPCAQAPSSLVRAKAKGSKPWTCKAYYKHKKHSLC